jgi:hypothetical protein
MPPGPLPSGTVPSPAPAPQRAFTYLPNPTPSPTYPNTTPNETTASPTGLGLLSTVSNTLDPTLPQGISSINTAYPTSQTNVIPQSTAPSTTSTAISQAPAGSAAGDRSDPGSENGSDDSTNLPGRPGLPNTPAPGDRGAKRT